MWVMAKPWNIIPKKSVEAWLMRALTLSPLPQPSPLSTM